MADKDSIAEEFANWGGGTKTSRPADVGPTGPNRDVEEPGKEGVTPSDYAPAPADNAGSAGPAPKGGRSDEDKVNFGVKDNGGESPAETAPARDAPTLTGLAKE